MRVQQVRPRVEHGLHEAEVVAAAAFDHVAGEREGAAGEADEGHAAVERLADDGDRVEDVAAARPCRRRQAPHVLLGAHGALELRALALGEVEAQPHRVGDGEDVGEEDGRVEREALQRLQRHLAGELGVLREGEEAAGLPARGVVLREVAPGLAHDPDRRVVGGLAQQGAQEVVVFHGGRFSHGRRAGHPETVKGGGRGRRRWPGA